MSEEKKKEKEGIHLEIESKNGCGVAIISLISLAGIGYALYILFS